MIDDLIQRMTFKDMNLDEILDFNESVKLFFDYASKNENKKLMSLGMDLIEDSATGLVDLARTLSKMMERFSI